MKVSVNQAREILGCSKPTIYAHIKKGNLHPIKKALGTGIGGERVYFDIKEIRAIANTNTSQKEKIVLIFQKIKAAQNEIKAAQKLIKELR